MTILKQIIFIPLGVKGGTISGVIQLVNKLNDEEIGEEERDTLLKLGPIIGNFMKSSLKNCRLESRLSDIEEGFKSAKIIMDSPNFKTSVLEKYDFDDLLPKRKHNE